MSSFVGSTQGIVPPPAEEIRGSLGTEKRERMWRERVAARAEKREREGERRAKERRKTVGECSQHPLRKMGALPHNSLCSYIMYIYSRKAVWRHRQGRYVTSHSVKTQRGKMEEEASRLRMWSGNTGATTDLQKTQREDWKSATLRDLPERSGNQLPLWHETRKLTRSIWRTRAGQKGINLQTVFTCI